jgi:hypothetical protein
MRKLIVLVVLVAMGLGLAGCSHKDAHQMYTERNIRLTYQADCRSLVDDIQWNITYDARPSHMSFFIQE